YTGNSISVVVLVGMILAILGVSKNIVHPSSNIGKLPLEIAPILIVIGLCVAIYMGYVEITQTKAICGPVGDCNTVQQSSYAYIFGIIPIGALGVLGYLIIAITWLFGNFGSIYWLKHSMYIFFVSTLLGTIFSIYLTFLEPFVIGASCAWCRTSAVVMTLLLVYSQGYIFVFKEL
ncbi:vitamin K epoxide reductase family protein, partial [bacterium]|nr:vitamin K epoxide reductase family protein [bacterium]